LYKKFLSSDIEGLTVSGGEPFSQPGGLLQLLRLCKESFGLTTVVYTGFLYEELKKGSLSGSTLKYIDVLIDGGYEEDKKEPTLLARGSTNQRFFFFNSRYQQDDFIMPAKVEIIIGKDGIIKETGFSKTNFNLN
jgi:anaerobic ribonucleoside-triphosphate reductase activating protein